MSREDQRRCAVKIGGEDAGLFDKRSGGNTKGEVTKYKEAQGNTVLLKGSPDAPEDIVLERRYDSERDHQNIGKWREGCCKLDVVVTEFLVDPDGNPIGKPDVSNGVLQEVEAPQYDSGSNNAQMLKLTIAIEKTI